MISILPLARLLPESAFLLATKKIRGREQIFGGYSPLFTEPMHAIASISTGGRARQSAFQSCGGEVLFLTAVANIILFSLLQSAVIYLPSIMMAADGWHIYYGRDGEIIPPGVTRVRIY